MRDGETWRLPTKTIADKEQSFEEIYWWLRGVGEEAQRQAIRRLAEAHHIDLSAQCRAMIMSWDELRNMAADPLVHIGAHTKDHFAVAKLLDKEAMEQMVGSADRIAQELGKRPVHFAYPYGDPASAGPRDFALAKNAGFKTAVTTRKGMLYQDKGSSDGAAARVPEWGLSVARLHGALSVRCALRAVERLPASQCRLTHVSPTVAASG
jgi:peptidoglycan/xylan/chitin deacetylase (PgdA/CDA1 family)